MRIFERLPPLTPEVVESMPREAQVMLLGYEQLRGSEEHHAYR